MSKGQYTRVGVLQKVIDLVHEITIFERNIMEIGNKR